MKTSFRKYPVSKKYLFGATDDLKGFSKDEQNIVLQILHTLMNKQKSIIDNVLNQKVDEIKQSEGKINT